MVRFVIWGAGGRGRIASKIFGKDRIVAYIDSDSRKVGKQFCGKPVIDFINYKREYSNYVILVSLANELPVINILKAEKVFFFSYNECPPELMGYGWKRAKKYMVKCNLQAKKIAIYGHSLYSVLLYEFLKRTGYECVGLIHSQGLCDEELESFTNFFPFIVEKDWHEIDEDVMILCSVPDDGWKKKINGWKVKDIYNWIDYIPDYQNLQIKELKNRYNKRRCFIVVTGPSLTFDDLEKLKRNREFCMSVNTIFLCFNDTEWRPDQYVVVDVDAIDKYGDDIRKMDVRQKFIADSSIDFDYDSLTEEFLIYHSVFSKDVMDKGLISNDFSKYAYNSGTVTAVCLQLAMYEGFEEIYLLGCDCSYFKTGIQHFNEPETMQIRRYNVIDDAVQMLKYHINAYQKIKEYAENRGIKIYNATRGGYLEVFERTNFDALF